MGTSADRMAELMRDAVAGEHATMRASRDRLARAYILLCEVTYGTKRGNAFGLHMEAHTQVTDADLAAVRDEVWAEIAKLPDDEEPEDEEENEWEGSNAMDDVG